MCKAIDYSARTLGCKVRLGSRRLVKSRGHPDRGRDEQYGFGTTTNSSLTPRKDGAEKLSHLSDELEQRSLRIERVLL